MMTWKEFVAHHMKGKKFTSRAEANAFFKQLAVEYRQTKTL